MKLRWSSFRCAFAGIALLLKTQPHARWHLLATCLVIALGAALRISRIDWLALILAMGLVWAMEAINTAIEQLGDAITKERHPLIGAAKDVSAGGVLLAAIFALGVGTLVFVPYLLR